MKRSCSAFLLLASACNQQGDAPPAQELASDNWKAAYTPAECKALIEKIAYVRRCHPGVDPNSENWIFEVSDENSVGKFKCMPYSRPERLAGVWVVGFESSNFYPNASSYEETLSLPEGTWLDADEPVPQEVTDAGQGAGTRAYSIEFVGRRSLCEWIYGHMGVSPREVVAQRIVSLRPLAMPQR